MRPATFILTIALAVGVTAVAMKFLPEDEPAPAPAPAPVVKEEKPKSKFRPPSPAPAVVNNDGKRPQLSDEMKAKFKEFGDETRKMALEIAGDEKRLQDAVRAGMMTAEGIGIMMKAREIGENFRKATTDAEREAALAEVPALRDQAMARLRIEVDKLNAPAPDAAPAAAGAPPPATPIM
ncbi:MAG: hypothetical protein ACO3ND_04145 [Opitutales bacterium]